MIHSFYPKYTEDIWHVGKNGNIYRLDSIERIVGIKRLFDNIDNVAMQTVDEMDDRLLTLAHSPSLIQAYKTGKPRGVAESAGVLWQENFYKWLINQSWASLYSVKESLKSGKAFALLDGGHHAEYDRGYGFGPINNLVIASNYLLKKNELKKIAILDIDVHYGNGTHSLVCRNSDILSTDIWKYKLDKWKFTPSDNNVLHFQVGNAKDYIDKLLVVLDEIRRFSPDLILIYLGLDVLNTDRMGGITKFHEKVLQERSRLLATFIERCSLPATIFMGGGYVNYQTTKDAAEQQKLKLYKLFKESIQAILSF